MAYHIFKNAVDTVETGSQYPQIQKMSPGYDYNAANSVHALSRSYSLFPDFAPNLDYFLLQSSAKFTDLISVAPVAGGFLISQKLMNLFSNYKIIAKKYYPARIMHKKNLYDGYFWMHIIYTDLSEYINFPKSKFLIYHNFNYNLGSIEINSIEEYFLKNSDLKSRNPGKTIVIWAEEICFFDAFKNIWDGFKIGRFDSNFYINDKVKNAVHSQGITGCDIMTAENLHY